jgi:hypothetical protein
MVFAARVQVPPLRPTLFIAVALALDSFGVAPQPPQAPEVDSVLRAAGRYLDAYERDITAVIAQEDYLQRVLTKARVRRLRSDLLIISDEHVGWVEFRDTFEVDGTRVRDRDQRIAQLFMKPNPNALQQARRIANEGARFNLSPERFAFNRTLNVPMTALRFLRKANQDRSVFRVDRVEPSGVVLRFKEEARPRLIATEDGAAASGSFTIDLDSGRVVRTEFTLPSRRVIGRFTVEYAEQPALKLWLPASMVESYTFPSGASPMDGRATYSNFRMFRVETSTTIVK